MPISCLYLFGYLLLSTGPHQPLAAKYSSKYYNCMHYNLRHQIQNRFVASNTDWNKSQQ